MNWWTDMVDSVRIVQKLCSFICFLFVCFFVFLFIVCLLVCLKVRRLICELVDGHGGQCSDS